MVRAFPHSSQLTTSILPLLLLRSKQPLDWSEESPASEVPKRQMRSPAGVGGDGKSSSFATASVAAGTLPLNGMEVDEGGEATVVVTAALSLAPIAGVSLLLSFPLLMTLELPALALDFTLSPRSAGDIVSSW